MNKFLILIVFLIKFNPSFTQIKFGSRIGVSISSAKFKTEGMSGSYNTGQRVGPIVSLFSDLKINENLLLGVDLSYLSMGYRLPKYDSLGQIYNLNDVMNYLTIPFILKYKINSLVIGAGPQFGYLMSVKRKDIFNLNYPQPEGFRKIDISTLFALEYYLKNKIILSARYQVGFSDFKNITHSDSYRQKELNRGLQITMGYIF